MPDIQFKQLSDSHVECLNVFDRDPTHKPSQPGTNNSQTRMSNAQRHAMASFSLERLLPCVNQDLAFANLKVATIPNLARPVSIP